MSSSNNFHFGTSTNSKHKRLDAPANDRGLLVACVALGCGLVLDALDALVSHENSSSLVLLELNI